MKEKYKNMIFNIILFDDFETLDVFGPIEILAEIKIIKLTIIPSMEDK